MRYFILAMLMAVAFHASAETPIESRMTDILVSNAISRGATYQLASRCGAEATALATYEARAASEAAEMKGSYQAMGVDSANAFSYGRRVGDKQFKQLGRGAEATSNCKAAIAALTCTGLMC
jgi:hypothetical protein